MGCVAMLIVPFLSMFLWGIGALNSQAAVGLVGGAVLVGLALDVLYGLSK